MSCRVWLREEEEEEEDVVGFVVCFIVAVDVDVDVLGDGFVAAVVVVVDDDACCTVWEDDVREGVDGLACDWGFLRAIVVMIWRDLLMPSLLYVVD